MSKRLGFALLAVAGGLLITTGTALANHDTAIYLADSSALENTELNARDKSGTSITPEEQKETKRDIRITAHIRKTVIKKALSIAAQNAKIITRNGVVTLRGPVESADESMKLQIIAEKTRGVTQVDNQLENIAP
jgi:osmotically-inducible protein OsmY